MVLRLQCDCFSVILPIAFVDIKYNLLYEYSSKLNCSNN
uniref:Uncharacterized protein n=1 Tax=Lepeophtheirus salmonis TaxID=72036 RepID=A0A0K2UL03_LEPSM